jgi:hypothetical protein
MFKRRLAGITVTAALLGGAPVVATPASAAGGAHAVAAKSCNRHHLT